MTFVGRLVGRSAGWSVRWGLAQGLTEKKYGWKMTTVCRRETLLSKAARLFSHLLFHAHPTCRPTTRAIQKKKLWSVVLVVREKSSVPEKQGKLSWKQWGRCPPYTGVNCTCYSKPSANRGNLTTSRRYSKLTWMKIWNEETKKYNLKIVDHK